jgi:hypothetical protein
MKTVLFWIGVVIVGLLSVQILAGLVNLFSAGIQSVATSLRVRAYEKTMKVAARKQSSPSGLPCWPLPAAGCTGAIGSAT